jgi:hypothetical protein
VKENRDALIDQLRICSDRATESRNEALAACRELQAELEANKLGNDYLSIQLSDNAGLLAEERDRTSQLYRQLASATHSEDKVLRALKSNADAILDKLYEVHAALELGEKDTTITEMLRQTFAAVQGANSSATDAVEHTMSLKSAVEAMGERYALINSI